MLVDSCPQNWDTYVHFRGSDPVIFVKDIINSALCFRGRVSVFDHPFFVKLNPFSSVILKVLTFFGSYFDKNIQGFKLSSFRGIILMSSQTKTGKKPPGCR